MSIAPLHRDTRGETPLIPPHLLTVILEQLKKQRGRISDERDAAHDAWEGIDKLNAAMEAAR